MLRKWSDMIDKKLRGYLLWAAAGMVLGYGYYSLLGFAGGMGPLPSNPLSFSPFPAILVGGVLGWLGFGGVKKGKERVPDLERAVVRVKADHRER